MTIAQLKREIKNGVKIEVVEVWERNRAKELYQIDVPAKMQGVGLVVEVNTTGFYMLRPNTESKRGSFCEWPKAKGFERYGDVFTITDDWGKRVYRIVLGCDCTSCERGYSCDYKG